MKSFTFKRKPKAQGARWTLATKSNTKAGDVVFFNRRENSPRTVVMMQDGDLIAVMNFHWVGEISEGSYYHDEHNDWEISL